MTINKKHINDYFANHWKGHLNDNYRFTNVENILKQIGRKDEVLDVGCGYNPFKESLGKRLYAFDPALSYGNEVTDIESFDAKGKQWDVVLCLGSINFGSTSVIKPQVEKVVSLVKPGGKIIWRQNPGLQDHNNQECEEITFFKWTHALNEGWPSQLGCTLEHQEWDYHETKKCYNRIYAIWRKNL